MKIGQSLGIAILVVGVVLLVFGYNSSETPVDQISNTLTGRYTDTTMWYIIVGIAMVVAGGFMSFFGARRV